MSRVNDPAKEWRGMPSFSHRDLTSRRRIEVRFRTEQDARDFFERLGQTVGPRVKSIWHPKAEIIRYGECR